MSTDEFAADLLRRVAGAQRRVLAQLMTFDGDDAGLALAEALCSAATRGVHVRLVIDCFALRYVSDERVTRQAVRDEFAATMTMYRRLAATGVEVVFTNPNGPLGLAALARNHKKLFVVDDVAYLGGINVSDHNYGWHDFMVAIERPDIVEAVVADLDATVAGDRRCVSEPILTNEAIEAAFDEMVLGAQHRVVIASPYAVDRHLIRLLRRSGARSKTAIVAPENNFWFLDLITPFVAGELARVGVELGAYGTFSHAKFVLSDDRLLIGSSNYGRHSFWCNQEIGLVIDDAAFVSDFADAMLADVRPVTVGGSRPRRWLGWAASAVMDSFLRAYATVVVPRVPLLADGVL